MSVVVKNLSKTYETATETVHVLNGVDLTIEEGEWVTVIGPSGTGKSTLLRCIGGMERPDGDSEILFHDWRVETAGGEKLAAYRRNNVGFIFQDYMLFDQFTVLDNVMLPMMPYEKKEALTGQALKLIEQFGLEHRQNHSPEQLSGGEKQRTAIARAMIHSPELLICDEPTGNLDRQNRDDVLSVLKDLQEKGHSILLVTHDMEAAFQGDRTYQLMDGRLESVEETRQTVPSQK